MQNQGKTKSLLTLKFSYNKDFNSKICTFYSPYFATILGCSLLVNNPILLSYEFDTPKKRYHAKSMSNKVTLNVKIQLQRRF